MLSLTERLAAFHHRNATPILMYHGVVPDNAPADTCMDMAGMNIRESTFRDHMRYVAENFRTITMRELVLQRRGLMRKRERQCVITFDDGLQNVVDIAVPIINEFGLTGVFYIMGATIDNQYRSWIHELYGLLDANSLDVLAKAFTDVCDLSIAEPRTRKNTWKVTREHFYALPRHERLRRLDSLAAETDFDRNAGVPVMSLASAQSLAEQGHEIGAHTLYHEPMASMTEDELAWEIEQNFLLMKTHFGIEATNFCYPFGGATTFNEQTEMKLKQAGFTSAVCTRDGLSVPSEDLFSLSRVHITHDMPIAEFRRKIHNVDGYRNEWKEFRQKWSPASILRRGTRRVLAMRGEGL